MLKAAIVGCVGVPGRYGGFETLAENLAHYSSKMSADSDDLTIYCSAPEYSEHPPSFQGVNLRYSNFKANGLQSVFYDSITAIDAVRRGCEVILILGVSGAIVIPILRWFSKVRIITNVDGVEWKRNKWSGLARAFLRFSEYIAVRFSHNVIADNQGIADHIHETYGVDALVIEYGGDHAVVHAKHGSQCDFQLPQDYALALCRIEPENNIEMILNAFSDSDRDLVFIGNWDNGNFGRELKERFSKISNLHLIDPIYELDKLYIIRKNASAYVHGHSAGGTNPSLVEAMHFNVPVIAFDCNFNRYTTENKAAYFSSAEELTGHICRPMNSNQGDIMYEIAQRRYRWDVIGARYFKLFELKA